MPLNSTVRCLGCRRELPRDAFDTRYLSNGRPNGIAARCRECRATYGPRPLAERFWEKVDRSGGAHACWIWLGGDDGAGYGSFRMPDRPHRAHRVAFFLTHGRWPKAFLCHDCPGGENTKCVNPEHMFEGDSAANNRDRANKGRSAIGSRHGKAKLTESDVVEMRRRHRSGEQVTSIARDFGIHHVTAWHAIHRKHWQHVP